MVSIFGLSLSLGVMVFLFGCATPARQTDSLLNSPPLNLPRTAAIANVPFVQQAAGHCGPATLTMAMQSLGKDVRVEDIAPEVITPGKKGSLQLDLISASRRHGLLAIPIAGMPALLTEVASGHPVIVLENLGLSWFPQWHYAIVFGYDLHKQEVLLHSGSEAFKRWDLSRFERSWMLADYWGLVVLLPKELSASADELSTMKAAAGLEQVGKNREAEQAYEKILERWPASLSALIGLGNLAFKKNDFHRAVQVLRMATELHPTSNIARHNLSVAENHLSHARHP